MTIRSNQRAQSFAGGATTQVFGPNPNRVGLIASPPDANKYFLGILEPAANNVGLSFTNGAMSPWILMFDKPNSFIGGPISVFPVVAEVICFIELLDYPD
jgi:hypothetical protein